MKDTTGSTGRGIQKVEIVVFQHGHTHHTHLQTK